MITRTMLCMSALGYPHSDFITTNTALATHRTLPSADASVLTGWCLLSVWDQAVHLSVPKPGRGPDISVVESVFAFY